MDFQAPKTGADVDAGKLRKLAQRVEKVLSEEVLYQEPKQLDPKTIIVAPLNREGAPPNVPHVHNILRNIKLKGFDRTRPVIGICVEFKSPEAKQKLLEQAEAAHASPRTLRAVARHTLDAIRHLPTQTRVNVDGLSPMAAIRCSTCAER